MEYLAGRELGQVMGARKRMNAEEVLPYLAQLCAAMQAAHDNGIVHRDLKPANIFVLDEEPGHAPVRVKVLDFGVAKLLDRPPIGYTTTPGALIGTPMFGAPEQLTAQADKICPQTDLYSLGVIVFWMLTGRPPYMADNNALLMAKHVEDPVPSILRHGGEVPQQAAELIERCLAKKPQDRPRSAGALAAGFRQAVYGRAANEEPVLVFAPQAVDDADDIAADDIANVSTLVEAAEPGVPGAATGDDRAPLASDNDPETQPARRLAGLAPEIAAPIEGGESVSTTTVEAIRQEVLAVEPPVEPPRDHRAQRSPRQITGPLRVGGREADRIRSATDQEHPASESDWSKPQPRSHREGRLPTMQRMASPPKPSYPVEDNTSELPPEPSKARALRLLVGLLALALIGALIALALQ
jgi:hypothetical protein